MSDDALHDRAPDRPTPDGRRRPVFVLVVGLVALALVFWTDTDAQTNSSHPAFLWALVVFLAPLLGLVFYLLLGRDGATGRRGQPPRGRPANESPKRPPM